MTNHRMLTLMLALCVPSMTWPQSHSQPDSRDEGSSGVTLTVAREKQTATTLQLRCRIRNDSPQDIWICDSMDQSEWEDVEVYIGQDNETLFVQRRLDVPMTLFRNQPIGRYARVPCGQTRTEVLSMTLPVRQREVLSGVRGASPAGRATRLVLEIGYYEGNLPATVLQQLEESVKSAAEKQATVPAHETSLAGMIRGVAHFNSSNRVVRARDDQVIIPWTDHFPKGERVLLATVDDLTIPYSDKYTSPKRIHVTPCKKIGVRFRGSPLGFCFPYSQEQSLLNEQERRSLGSIQGFVIEDPRDIMETAYVASESLDGVFYTDRGAADVTCHRKDGSVLSFTIYDGAYIVMPDGQVFRCRDQLTKLRMFSPQVKGLDLRMQCVANLKNLWYFLHLYPILTQAPKDDTSKTSERTYPTADKWCDAARGQDCACPGAAEGKCHYAMNADCRYDSPGDTVLLFETKAGWNQHGGPELFAFDNHDPRGGLVLLNDGTVRFIRGEDELRQLRWK